MKNVIKALAISLCLASLVFAKSEVPKGDPPHGLKAQSNAKGTKLSGALLAEFHNCDFGSGLCQARFVLRLRRKNATDFDTFYDDTNGLQTMDPTNPAVTQQAIIDLMTPQVLNSFFGGDMSLQIFVTSLSEFGELGVLSTDLTSFGSQFVLTDLQVAVN